MRALVTDLGSTIVPRCTAHRRSTWAGDLPVSAATRLMTASSIRGGLAWCDFMQLPGDPSDVCAVTTMPAAWQ